jgi:hypothetical protein
VGQDPGAGPAEHVTHFGARSAGVLRKEVGTLGRGGFLSPLPEHAHASSHNLFADGQTEEERRTATVDGSGARTTEQGGASHEMTAIPSKTETHGRSGHVHSNRQYEAASHQQPNTTAQFSTSRSITITTGSSTSHIFPLPSFLFQQIRVLTLTQSQDAVYQCPSSTPKCPPMIRQSTLSYYDWIHPEGGKWRAR